jgi:hypothetical protein
VINQPRHAASCNGPSRRTIKIKPGRRSIRHNRNGQPNWRASTHTDQPVPGRSANRACRPGHRGGHEPGATRGAGRCGRAVSAGGRSCPIGARRRSTMTAQIASHPPDRSGRRMAISLSAVAGIGYTPAWIVSLSAGAPNPSVAGPGSQVVAAFAGRVGYPPHTIRLLADSTSTGGRLTAQRVTLLGLPMAPTPSHGPQAQNLDRRRPRLRGPAHRHADPVPARRHRDAASSRIDNILSIRKCKLLASPPRRSPGVSRPAPYRLAKTPRTECGG